MTQTIASALQRGTELLSTHNIPSPDLDCKVFLSHLLGKESVYLFLNLDELLSSSIQKKFAEYVQRRCGNEPCAYIVGEQEFWSLRFKVTADTFIPRPDTEILVEESGKFLTEKLATTNKSLLGLDIGTGSGNIPCALVSEIPEMKMIAVDLSTKALAVAKENAHQLGFGERIAFVQGNLLTPFKSRLEKGTGFDIIVSNPPYIRSDDIDGLMPDVACFEPSLALDGGGDGLDVYKQIISMADSLLKEEGGIFFEIGVGQEKDVVSLIDQTGVFGDCEVIRDYSNILRVVKAIKIRGKNNS